MLGLKLPTDPRWVGIAEKNIEEILVDHAYCEQKAASTCISLIVNYYDKKELVEVLTPVVQEEWEHFEQVLQRLEERNLPLGAPRKDEYVVQLNKLKRKGLGRDLELMDRLLVCALIEARSCERFRLLSQEIADASLRDWYHDLMKSEAGHYMNFVKLAKCYVDEATVDQRLEEFLEEEAKIMEKLGVQEGRVH